MNKIYVTIPSKYSTFYIYITKQRRTQRITDQYNTTHITLNITCNQIYNVLKTMINILEFKGVLF